MWSVEQCVRARVVSFHRTSTRNANGNCERVHVSKRAKRDGRRAVAVMWAAAPSRAAAAVAAVVVVAVAAAAVAVARRSRTSREARERPPAHNEGARALSRPAAPPTAASVVVVVGRSVARRTTACTRTC